MKAVMRISVVDCQNPGWRLPAGRRWRKLVPGFLLVLTGWAVGSAALGVAQAQETTAQTAAHLTPELLWKLGRIGDGTLSPDGNWLASTVRRFSLAENHGRSELVLTHTSEGQTRSLLQDWPGISHLQWRGSKDDFRLYFTGVDPERPDRGAQVYRWNPGMEQPARISDLDGGVANLKVSPTEQHIAYTARIKMDATVQDLYADLPKADARIIDALMFRHWDAWRDFKYSHLHVAPLSTEEGVGQSRDLMAGLRADCPVPPFGGASQFDWSPDGLELAYTTKIDENMAQSTNSDIYLIDVQGLNPPRNITAGQMGYDNDPKYSPDGRFIAYHSMERPGFEADRNRIMLYDRAAQKSSDLTAGLDQNADHARWLPDASGLVFESDYRGCLQLFAIRLAGRAVTQLTRDPANHALADVTPDGRSVLVAKNDMIQPADWFLLDLEAGGQRRLSDVNRPLLESLELPTFEERWVPATDGKSIHCWVIYPPGFDPQSGQKYPLLTFCQGGPQGQVSQFFSYRWNFHLMAAQGYIVLAPNRRGLPGFGRAWNDQISGDWGGQAMQDLLSATDALRREPYVDAQRVGAVGASFGGYTVYWLMGNAGDRFAAMISHCGVFNLESMYASTEELFFVDWDLGGPYWRSPEARQKYEQFSPNRYIQNWKTPLLVIHGEKDFRVPINQGLEAFTTAQLQGVPSRFLYFPNEGHWVMQPQNGVLWHRVFFEWLDQYLKP